MRRAVGLLIFALACLAMTGCFRTLYTQFSPQSPLSASHPVPDYKPVRKSGWQSFFLYGWVPSTRKIDAEKMCGGTDHIQSIHTELTFAEGLVGDVAGYYINIYSPYNGAVYCQAKP